MMSTTFVGCEYDEVMITMMGVMDEYEVIMRSYVPPWVQDEEV